MGWLQNEFLIFWQNNPDLSQKAAFEIFTRGEAPNIDASDDHDLTWNEIDALTRGDTGEFNVACPYCGPDKPNSTRFKINRYSLSAARYYCFYCNRGGAVRCDGPVDPVKEAEARRRAAARKADQQAERIAYALRLWDEAISLTRSTLAQRYFAARAISELPPNLDEVLRWHQSCPFGTYGNCPVMLALFRDGATNEPTGIHRTFIIGGAKAERMTLGRMVRAAIKLFPLDGDQLFVAEGIENALSLSLGTFNGRPLRPVWAAGPAGNLAKLPLVPGVRRLVICADNGKAGEENAATCARRWRAAGREVEVIMPTQNGIDWNDLLKGNKNDQRD